MNTFAVTTQVEHFVLYTKTALTVVEVDLVLKTLPLSFGVARVIFAVGKVGAIDQTEISSAL